MVGPGGWLKGTITCMDADIQGQLEGKINVTNTLAIQEKGDVRGEINYKQLQVALGGQLAEPLARAVHSNDCRPKHCEKGSHLWDKAREEGQ